MLIVLLLKSLAQLSRRHSRSTSNQQLGNICDWLKLKCKVIGLGGECVAEWASSF